MQQDATAERRVEVDRGLGTGRDGTVELHLQVFDLADDAVVEQLEGTSEHRMEHVVETLREDEPACFGLIDHRAGLTGVHGDRLLRQDVQPSLECLRRPLEPQRGRQRHVDGVEIVAFEQRRIGIGHRTDAVASANTFARSGSRAATATTSTSSASRGRSTRGSDAGRTKHPEAKTSSYGGAHRDIPFHGKRVRGERLVQNQASRSGDRSPLVAPLDTVEAHGRRTAPSHAARNRQALLSAARKVMSEQGLDAPLDEIARRAGVGNATLYRRFPTRTELIVAVCEERMAEHVRAVEEALAEPDSWEAFPHYITAAGTLRRATERSPIWSRWTCRVHRKSNGFVSAAVRGIETLIKRAKSAGTLRADCTAEDVLILLQSNAGLVERSKGVAASASQRLVHLLLDGLPPRTRLRTVPFRRHHAAVRAAVRERSRDFGLEAGSAPRPS